MTQNSTKVLPNPVIERTIRPINQDFGLGKVDVEPMYQVVLYNDDVHQVTEVVQDLARVFGHSSEVAIVIIKEIEAVGKGIAEVEPKEQAIKHKEMLESAKYTVAVEPIY